VLPGHIEVLDRQLFPPLTGGDAEVLADLLSPVRPCTAAGPGRPPRCGTARSPPSGCRPPAAGSR
jgi:hypothetical protein